MTEYIAAFAPDDLPDIEYTRTDEVQAAHMRAAMELPENQARFELTFLTIETPEQRWAAALEWAGYLQAAGCVRARDEGAIFVTSSRDDSPEALLRLIEDCDREDVNGFVTYAVTKTVKKIRGVSTYASLRTYNGDEEEN